MVSSSRLIWLTETPNSAGIMSLRMRRTPGWCQPSFGRGSRCNCVRKGSWNSSCTRPAANTPQASA